MAPIVALTVCAAARSTVEWPMRTVSSAAPAYRRMVPSSRRGLYACGDQPLHTAHGLNGAAREVSEGFGDTARTRSSWDAITLARITEGQRVMLRTSRLPLLGKDRLEHGLL